MAAHLVPQESNRQAEKVVEIQSIHGPQPRLIPVECKGQLPQQGWVILHQRVCKESGPPLGFSTKLDTFPFEKHVNAYLP